jgi:starch-binding outer membrane protein, SusD/RagB family
MKNRRSGVMALAAALALGACSMDLTDPNFPTEDEAISTPRNIGLLAIGLQAEYGNQLVDPVYSVGLVTNELGAGHATFDSYQRADRGEPITGDDGPATDPWSGQYDVIRTANVLIQHAPNVGFGPGTTSGIVALAKLYKAMALGNLYQIYERAPIHVDPTNAHADFATRAEVIAEVLRLLDEARQHVTGTPTSAEFRSTILAPGFDLENTIDAMLARYHLIAGNLAQARTAAERVDLTVLSEHRFSASDVNPLWNMWYNSGNAFQMRAKQAFRLEAEPGDGRVAYWVSADTIIGATGRLDQIARYSTSTASFPVYLPGEMRLIIAEVYARQNDLPQALLWVNQVRTQCTSPVAEPLACLPALTLADVPTQEAMLAEILRQRRYELYLQGLRWSDLRRFGQPVKYTFMPIPTSECDRNRNAPC